MVQEIKQNKKQRNPFQFKANIAPSLSSVLTKRARERKIPERMSVAIIDWSKITFLKS